MSMKALFLSWQDNMSSHQWFPVGRLDVDMDDSRFWFRYTGGAQRAQKEAGFPLLLEFPALQRAYTSRELFPLFRNRVMNPSRPDLVDYMHSLDLSEEARSNRDPRGKWGRSGYRLVRGVSEDREGYRWQFRLPVLSARVATRQSASTAEDRSADCGRAVVFDVGVDQPGDPLGGADPDERLSHGRLGTALSGTRPD